MTKLYENIRRLRKQRRMSQGELAKRTGYTDHSSIARIESGEIDLPQSKIQLFADVFNVTPQQLMGYDDIKLPMFEERTIPIFSQISCGTGMFVDDYLIGNVTVPLDMLPNKSADYFAQYASGDSMINAGINDGDLLIFKQTQAIDNGAIGCFCIGDQIATCKKFSRTGDNVFLMPANDKYSPIVVDPENEDFRVIGVKVLQITK